MKTNFFLFVLLFLSVHLYSQIKTGIRISFLTDKYTTEAQERFVNTHFDYVMTPVLSEEMRNKYDSVKLLLYRSIRGMWEDTLQFDWNFVNSNENMFCHYDSLVQDSSTRIKTKYDSFLMDGGDIVPSNEPDALHHWINYYAVTASQQVDSCNYDGLFMDSAGHKLNKDELADTTKMPWDYSDSVWREDRYVALNFVKSYLPDKLVIFNGLHSGNGADSSLYLTDGGMWEDFAYNCETGNYKGVGAWWQAISCMQENRNIAKLILTVKKPGLISDEQARTFSVASYFLIENENTVLTLSDYSVSSYIQYYPELTIDLGQPTGDFYMTSDSAFVRKFTNGMVIVNPFGDDTKHFVLNKNYYKIYGECGGIIDSLGNYNGYLVYEEADNELDIPPVSGVILVDTVPAGAIMARNDFLLKTYPNPFVDNINIEFCLPKKLFAYLIITDGGGKTVAILAKGKKFDAGTHTITWNARNFPQGTYHCILLTSEGKYSREIIKQ